MQAASGYVAQRGCGVAPARSRDHAESCKAYKQRVDKGCDGSARKVGPRECWSVNSPLGIVVQECHPKVLNRNSGPRPDYGGRPARRETDAGLRPGRERKNSPGHGVFGSRSDGVP